MTRMKPNRYRRSEFEAGEGSTNHDFWKRAVQIVIFKEGSRNRDFWKRALRIVIFERGQYESWFLKEGSTNHDFWKKAVRIVIFERGQYESWFLEQREKISHLHFSKTEHLIKAQKITNKLIPSPEKYSSRLSSCKFMGSSILFTNARNSKKNGFLRKFKFNDF
jgi:hypothetical protein